MEKGGNPHWMVMATNILSCIGGVLFVVGSVVYWPSLANDFNPNTGGILFIIGSCFFFFCDLMGHKIDPHFSPFKPFRNIGCLRAMLTMLGNMSFIVGSVYFLAMMPSVVGVDIFVIGSMFIWIPQILICFGLYVCNAYTAEFYYELLPFRKLLVITNMLLGLACMFFSVGSILFYDENS